jgi:hypothetical protein
MTNPRHKAGLCGSVQDRAFGQKKRVRRFERPTFTLATCKHTDAAASTESISCGDGKGVTNTVTTCSQDTGLSGLNNANSVGLCAHISGDLSVAEVVGYDSLCK